MKKSFIYPIIASLLYLSIFFLGHPPQGNALKDFSQAMIKFEVEKNQWLLKKKYEARLFQNRKDLVEMLKNLFQHKLKLVARREALLEMRGYKLSRGEGGLIRRKKAFRMQHKKFEKMMRQKIRPAPVFSDSGAQSQEMQSRFNELKQGLLVQEGKLERARDAARRVFDQKTLQPEPAPWQLPVLPPVEGVKVLMTAPVAVTTGDSGIKNYPSLFRGRATASRNY